MPNSPNSFNSILNLASDSIALRCGTQNITYKDLQICSDHFASELSAIENLKEKTVGILAPSSLEFAVAMVATWKAGAIAVPLQPHHPRSEIEYIVQDSGLNYIFFHQNCAHLAKDIAKSNPVKLFELSLCKESATKNLKLTSPSTSSAVRPRPSQQGALMIYTSGTTNRPKGVISTIGSLNAQMASLQEAWAWSKDDRILNILPLHHVHGLVNVLCCSLSSGAYCELADKFTPDLVWDRIASDELTVFMAVPTVYAKLIQHWQSQPKDTQVRLSLSANKLRLMVSGSAALPSPIFDAWYAISGKKLLERYGMTEIGMALSNPYTGERKPRTVGIPLPSVAVRLMDENAKAITGSNIPGEIQVRGPTLFKEYWKNPQATEDSFTQDGWFKTGDIAERDNDGYFKILGRNSQDIIKSGGYKISALEIESALLEHPQIKEAAVIGISDEIWGEKIVAFCVLKNFSPELNSTGQLKDDLRNWLGERIAHYKIPSVWHYVADLPRNSMGKILKSDLKKLP